ncbi:MAG: hypothetical protein JW395_0318 [Nitrospira sp.]|nr:hypothetical protein [Nitrospira sp.]
MFYYFGYGSNMNLASLRAKGVEAASSCSARLNGYRLAFNVTHFFRHEGAVANIVADFGEAYVLGVLHACEDDALVKLDAAEAYGHGYDRIKIKVEVDGQLAEAFAYVGMPSFLDDRCRPSRRYLNILISGAEAAGIAPAYVDWLRGHPIHEKSSYPPFRFPDHSARYDAVSLAAERRLTALAGGVFDMSGARSQHDFLKGFFGGKDRTLFHLRRMDRSPGTETEEDISQNRLSPQQRLYLNEYLHEYCSEYQFVGRYIPHQALIHPNTQHIL